MTCLLVNDLNVKKDKMDITFNGISQNVVYEKSNKWRPNFEKWTNLIAKNWKKLYIKPIFRVDLA